MNSGTRNLCIQPFTWCLQRAYNQNFYITEFWPSLSQWRSKSKINVRKIVKAHPGQNHITHPRHLGGEVGFSNPCLFLLLPRVHAIGISGKNLAKEEKTTRNRFCPNKNWILFIVIVQKSSIRAKILGWKWSWHVQGTPKRSVFVRKRVLTQTFGKLAVPVWDTKF